MISDKKIAFIASNEALMSPYGLNEHGLHSSNDINTKDLNMENFLHYNPLIFLSLLDHLSEGVVIHRADTSILYANRAATEILGVSYATIMGKTVTDPAWYFIDEAMNPLPIESYPVNRIFATSTNIVHQIMGIHLPDGKLRWVDINATLASAQLGEKIAMIVFSDVTERKNAYEEAALFKKVIEAVDTGVTIADPSQEDCPLIYANEAFTTMTGYSLDESLHKNCRFLQGDDREQIGRTQIAEALKNGTSCNVELKNYTKEGKLFHNLLTLSPLKKEGVVQYFVGVQHNITAIKEQEKHLYEKNLYIQSILDAQDDLVLISDGENALYSNQKLLEFFGVGTLEQFLEGGSCICSRFIADEKCFYQKNIPSQEMWIDAMMKLSLLKRIIAMNALNGETHYFSVNAKAFHSDHYIITLHDITISVLKEQLLSTKAYHDPLTGAYNRQYFYEYLSKDLTLRGVIMVDLDNFKSVNDTYGHDKGDEVLKKTIRSIMNSLRSDDYVVRWGGEEIVVFLQAHTKNQLILVAENIRHAIELNVIEGIGTITASLGVAMKHPNESLENAITFADEALYRAKRSGKNRVVCHEPIN